MKDGESTRRKPSRKNGLGARWRTDDQRTRRIQNETQMVSHVRDARWETDVQTEKMIHVPDGRSTKQTRNREAHGRSDCQTDGENLLNGRLRSEMARHERTKESESREFRC